MRQINPPAQYDRENERTFRNECVAEDARNYKKREHIDLDPSTYIVMTSPGGARYALTVSDVGALVVTAL